MSAPQLPLNAPFSTEQRAWLNGWIAGVLSLQLSSSGNGSAPAPVAALPLLILYGTQTGSAEGLAKKLAKAAQSKGFAPKVLGMDEYGKVDLAACERLLCITSTYGDGEPPDNATAFWEWLNAETAPRLEAVQFSVLALGDTNYEKFCQFGKDIDARLEALGAQRVHDRVDCETDYDVPFAAWMAAAIGALPSGLATASAEASVTAATGEALVGETAAVGTKANPYEARLIDNRLLTSENASKETRHFGIHLNGLQYEVGDALGVIPANQPQLVSLMLEAGGWTGEESVGDIPLSEALHRKFDLGNPSRDLLQAVAERAKHEDLADMLKPERSSDLKTWLHGRDVLDVIQMCPKGELKATELTDLLKKLQPLLYSIASSLKAAPGEVHLTVAQVRYEKIGRVRHGVCSTFLADRVNADTPLPVFIQTSHGFRLPTDTSKPVIMVGPGTGVAPFRAFLQERQATGGGKNWLFFGEQSRAMSYFYKDEWAAMIKQGSLHRLDTAFSRDQEQKIYVQNRMLENGEELHRWLEEGAHFYVCGDASRMAKDVDAALHEVVQKHGSKTEEQAAAYIAEMKKAKRYARDVY
ncbi:MAG: cysJ [Verrucomicrobiaceae bacterium]|nr:cysJ [Verrucomicrobiaceae bacterium]